MSPATLVALAAILREPRLGFRGHYSLGLVEYTNGLGGVRLHYGWWSFDGMAKGMSHFDVVPFVT